MENLNPYQLRISLPEGREKMHCKVWVIAMDPGVSVFEERLSQLSSAAGARASRPLGRFFVSPQCHSRKAQVSLESCLISVQMSLIPSDQAQLKQAGGAGSVAHGQL